MVESSRDDRLGTAIFGDGAACADDDLVNVDEAVVVVLEGEE
jgi:hypothetical protein